MTLHFCRSSFVVLTIFVGGVFVTTSYEIFRSSPTRLDNDKPFNEDLFTLYFPCSKVCKAITWEGNGRSSIVGRKMRENQEGISRILLRNVSCVTAAAEVTPVDECLENINNNNVFIDVNKQHNFLQNFSESR